jgi:acetoin utilization protein AcuB
MMTGVLQRQPREVFGMTAPRNPCESEVCERKDPLSVERWMSRHVSTTRPDACLLDAFEMMRDHRIRHVPVLEGEKLVGIVSDRDVRSALPSRRGLQEGWASLGSSLLTTRVAQVMTVMPITIAPDASIREAAQILCRDKIGALPVMSGGKLIGILSAEDILWAFAEGAAAAKEPAPAVR